MVASKSLHSDRVNCVKWIKTDSPDGDLQWFLSGGVDKKLLLCQYHTSNLNVSHHKM